MMVTFVLLFCLSAVVVGSVSSFVTVFLSVVFCFRSVFVCVVGSLFFIMMKFVMYRSLFVVSNGGVHRANAMNEAIKFGTQNSKLLVDTLHSLIAGDSRVVAILGNSD